MHLPSRGTIGGSKAVVTRFLFRDCSLLFGYYLSWNLNNLPGTPTVLSIFFSLKCTYIHISITVVSLLNEHLFCCRISVLLPAIFWQFSGSGSQSLQPRTHTLHVQYLIGFGRSLLKVFLTELLCCYAQPQAQGADWTNRQLYERLEQCFLGRSKIKSYHVELLIYYWYDIGLL